MNKQKVKGMIAATFTPMKDSGEINPDVVPQLVEQLITQGVSGIFVCGSTGEGPSLTTEERKVLAEAFVQSVNKRIPVFVHVGHNSLSDAKSLAEHAQLIGADFISSVSPSYYKMDSVPLLVNSLAGIASRAPQLPFYYYNIPNLTGVSLDMINFLELAYETIPSFAGIKYTTPLIHEYQACLNFQDNKFDILYGTDEMLLSALCVGAGGYIGSTYNFAAPWNQQILDNFQNGNLETARRYQLKSVELVRIIVKYGGLPAQKIMMKLAGMDCGPVRLPLRQLSLPEILSLEKELQKTGFFEMAGNTKIAG
jgi:N-acetylneuraminate lyase